jgi:hypothetical protein
MLKVSSDVLICLAISKPSLIVLRGGAMSSHVRELSRWVTTLVWIFHAVKTTKSRVTEFTTNLTRGPWWREWKLHVLLKWWLDRRCRKEATHAIRLIWVRRQKSVRLILAIVLKMSRSLKVSRCILWLTVGEGSGSPGSKHSKWGRSCSDWLLLWRKHSKLLRKIPPLPKVGPDLPSKWDFKHRKGLVPGQWPWSQEAFNIYETSQIKSRKIWDVYMEPCAWQG